MKRALIACGGTGGHLSPGIALAEELTSRGWICTLLISNKQVDSRLVEKYTDFEYVAIDGKPFAKRPDQFLAFLVSLCKGTSTCRKLIKRHQPSVVIGFGGFLSMPALLAGYLSRVPTAIHEANQVPGRVTRLASRFVKRVYLPPDVKMKPMRSARIQSMGMPVRREILASDRSEAKQSLGLDPSQKLLLVMGGSQGAEALNRWVETSFPVLAKNAVQVFCLTGSSGEERTLMESSASGEAVNAVFQKFSDNMSLVLSAADFAISRSGAGSIAEMIQCKVPGILVPYPFSADDHQIENAKAFERLGCGRLVMQDNLDTVLDLCLDLMLDESRRRALGEKMEQASSGNAARDLALDLESFASDAQPGEDTPSSKEATA